MEKTDTKSSLLETGLELFSRSTYEGVGVQDIVNQIHVTKPTLYHYFKSKLGFYCAVFETYAFPYLEIIQKSAEYKHDLTNNLNELAKVSMEFFLSNPKIFWLLEYSSHVSLDAEHHDFVSQFWHSVTKCIEDLFNAAIVQHGNLRDKTAITAWLFIHTIRAEIHAILIQRHPYKPDLPYQLVHQFMYGIFS